MKEVKLPSSLTHLDLKQSEIPVEFLNRLIFPPTGGEELANFPRLKILDVSGMKDRVDPSFPLQLLKNGHHPFVKLSVSEAAPSTSAAPGQQFPLAAITPPDLVRFNPQPLITKLDISNMGWFSGDLLKAVVNKDILPALVSLKFSPTWACTAKNIDEWLGDLEKRPPKLSTLCIEGSGFGLFATQGLTAPFIKKFKLSLASSTDIRSPPPSLSLVSFAFLDVFVYQRGISTYFELSRRWSVFP